MDPFLVLIYSYTFVAIWKRHQTTNIQYIKESHRLCDLESQSLKAENNYELNLLG